MSKEQDEGKESQYDKGFLDATSNPNQGGFPESAPKEGKDLKDYGKGWADGRKAML